jgi:hypothetical protein
MFNLLKEIKTDFSAENVSLSHSSSASSFGREDFPVINDEFKKLRRISLLNTDESPAL